MLSLADRLRLLAFEAALDQDRELWAALNRAAELARKQALNAPATSTPNKTRCT